MVKAELSERPNMDEVVVRFKKTVDSLSWWKLRSRIVGKKDFFVLTFFRFWPYLFRTARYVVTRKPAIPS